MSFSAAQIFYIFKVNFKKWHNLKYRYPRWANDKFKLEINTYVIQIQFCRFNNI